ncbi:MAG TPA: dual specificity protein phosphatase [Ktedonobacterales bacterium]
MSTSTSGKHLRFFRFPYHEQVFDGTIERICEAPGPRQRRDLCVDFWAFHVHERTVPLLIDNQPWEIARGERVPLRLRFEGVRWLRHGGVFADLAAFAALPADHSARRLFAVTHLRLPGQEPMYWFYTDTLSAYDVFCLRAAGCVLEARPGAAFPVVERRRWAPRPPTLDRLVPLPRTLHRRYGGDPIAIQLGRRRFRERLFIGGFHHQHAERPLVDHVLNLTSDPHPWNAAYGRHPGDRYAPKLEAQEGMGGAELLGEAAWVAERLRAGRRVLVHCVAGVNRSSTVCCAALMLLEGLSAEAALARVRERHPEAAPDPYYWFLLRWLANPAAPGPEPAWESDLISPPSLRETVSVG